MSTYDAKNQISRHVIIPEYVAQASREVCIAKHVRDYPTKRGTQLPKLKIAYADGPVTRVWAIRHPSLSATRARHHLTIPVCFLMPSSSRCTIRLRACILVSSRDPSVRPSSSSPYDSTPSVTLPPSNTPSVRVPSPSRRSSATCFSVPASSCSSPTPASCSSSSPSFPPPVSSSV